MLDPRLLHTFRRKIAHPAHWHRTYRILRSYNRHDLATHEGAGHMVDHLSGALGVPISLAQRANAVNWIVAQRIDPHHPWHQARMWRVVNGE